MRRKWFGVSRQHSLHLWHLQQTRVGCETFRPKTENELSRCRRSLMSLQGSSVALFSELSLSSLDMLDYGSSGLFQDSIAADGTFHLRGDRKLLGSDLGITVDALIGQSRPNFFLRRFHVSNRLSELSRPS